MHTSGGGGTLKYLWWFGDLDAMYTALSFARMSEALQNNIAWLKASSAPDRRYPSRGLDRISVGRTKQEGIRACALGPAYNNDEQIEINDSRHISTGRSRRCTCCTHRLLVRIYS